MTGGQAGMEVLYIQRCRLDWRADGIWFHYIYTCSLLQAIAVMFQVVFLPVRRFQMRPPSVLNA